MVVRFGFDEGRVGIVVEFEVLFVHDGEGVDVRAVDGMGGVPFYFSFFGLGKGEPVPAHLDV